MFDRHRRALGDRHYQVFLAALAIVFLHLTEDALVHEENGESLGAKLGAVVLNLVLLALGAGLYPRVWRRVLPLFVLAFGLLAFVRGGRAHVSDLLAGDAGPGAYSRPSHPRAALARIALALTRAPDAVPGRTAPAAG